MTKRVHGIDVVPHQRGRRYTIRGRWDDPGMTRLRLLAIIPSLLLLSACGGGNEPAPAEQAGAAASVTTTVAAPKDEIGYDVSPAGVTTAVRGIDVDTSSASYQQTCADAATWLYGTDGTPEQNAEDFLALMQADPEAYGEDAASGEYWADGTPQEHAEVIAAVQAAARGECEASVDMSLPSEFPVVPTEPTPNAVDSLPNPYPNSVDSYGRPSGSSSRELVGCADRATYQPGTGIYSDGSMDFAPECLIGGSMSPER